MFQFWGLQEKYDIEKRGRLLKTHHSTFDLKADPEFLKQ